MRSRRIVVVLGVVAILAAAGAAYATIPDSGGVYTACMLRATGTIRLIDPSGPSTSLLSRCTQFEAQVTWNKSGKDGVSPTVAPLSAGDSHCPAGGAALTDAAGSTAYVCSAQTSGTFTSPNGMFSLSVKDDGVEMVGPDASIKLDSSGGIEVIAQNEAITVHGNRTEKVDQNENIEIGGNRSEKVSGNSTVKVSGSHTIQAAAGLDLSGATVGINRSAACKLVARVTDLIDPVGNTIITGSPTVCID